MVVLNVKLYPKVLLLMIAIMLLTVTDSFSQDDPYQKIDARAKRYKPKTLDLEQIATDLTKNIDSELSRVRSLYSFVINYLDYDHEAYKNGNRRINQSSRDILERKRAVCWGYAQLFKELCTHAGIQAYTVSGYSNLVQTDFSKPDHAWNVVRIKDEYYLMDVTWASNTLRTPDKFNKKFDVDYFLTPPDLFVINHYPILSFWQLLKCPVDFASYIGQNNTYHEGAKEDCGYNFMDSIQHFLAMDTSDRIIKEMDVAFREQPSDRNKSSLAHALIDKAILEKERADATFEVGDLPASIRFYQSALDLFGKGEALENMYDWQIESKGFCMLNHAQALYRIQYAEGVVDYPEVVSELKKAEEVLRTIREPSFAVIQALSQIGQNLAAIE